MSIAARRIVRGRPGSTGVLRHDWSDTNLPWAYTATTEWESRIPAGQTRVALSTTGTTFRQRLDNTLAGVASRAIIDLPAGTYTLSNFRMIGTSGDPTYAYGYWNPKLAGFCGAGPDKTVIEFAANAPTYDTDGATDRTTDAHTAMSSMTTTSFSPLSRGVLRIDATGTNRFFLGGITVRAANQLPLTSVDTTLSQPSGNWGVTTPQPSPHQGVAIFPGSTGVVSHVRFQGAGKAMSSAPPFEMANITSQKCTISWYNVELDGRLAAVYDAARPRKCGVWMGNNELVSDFNDCWFHHSNLTRYAANDENVNTAALSTTYLLTRCKIEQITNTQNDGHGGYTNACLLGWESSNAQLNLQDVIASVDNPYVDSHGISLHAQLTNVGARAPTGGRLSVIGGAWRNTGFPEIEGFFTLRCISTTSFYTEGLANTVTVRDTLASTPKTAYVYTGTWPPSAAALAASGVTPATHYLVRTS